MGENVANRSGLPTVSMLATGGTIAGEGAQGKATNYRPGQAKKARPKLSRGRARTNKTSPT